MKRNLRYVSLVTSIIAAAFILTGLFYCLKSFSARAAPIKVGLITGTDTLSSKSISWMSYQGLVRAEQELGVTGTVYTSTNPSEFEPNVLQCAADGNDLCIGVGFQLADAISKTASISPTVKFTIIDTAYDSYTPNLRAIVFRSEQVGYLAGTLAAMMSQSKIIGDLGGMPIPPVTDFTESYAKGAHCADPSVTTIVSYTNSFDDPVIGAELTQDMIHMGADVIFAAAGASGNGGVLTATQSGVWAIGVDTDEYISLFDNGNVPGASFLLTSAMKRYDSAVYNTISDVVDGLFTSGLTKESLVTDGVGLAPYHETEDLIRPSIKTWLEWIQRGLIGGAIEPLNPDGPCLVMHQQFLPLAQR